MLTYNTYVQSYVDCSVKRYKHVCIFVRQGHFWPVLGIKLKATLRQNFPFNFFKEDAGPFVM